MWFGNKIIICWKVSEIRIINYKFFCFFVMTTLSLNNHIIYKPSIIYWTEKQLHRILDLWIFNSSFPNNRLTNYSINISPSKANPIKSKLSNWPSSTPSSCMLHPIPNSPSTTFTKSVSISSKSIITKGTQLTNSADCYQESSIKLITLWKLCK